MAPKRQRRPINKSPMSGSFKTPKKAKKPTIVGESLVFQQIVTQQLEALMPEIVNHEMAPKRPRRPINRSPMSGFFKTPKKAKKPTIVGESPVFQQIINQQLEA
ncbi:hypothetical protein CTI12_AA503600 [Artemisia annua]|uniref:Uncharacterized protein n=1 Tax=Artemisia annua TaxID=35608 RepID=A0A2U1LDC9_ARTAN|nr:hypothetical protein CTI12_AA503600 [Artemisia annua]